MSGDLTPAGTEPLVPSARIKPLNRTGEGTGVVSASRAVVTSNSERDAILKSMYADRKPLLAKRRTQELSRAEEGRLADLNAEIDRWEQMDRVPRESDPLWQKIDGIAARLLKI